MRIAMRDYRKDRRGVDRRRQSPDTRRWRYNDNSQWATSQTPSHASPSQGRPRRLPNGTRFGGVRDFARCSGLGGFGIVYLAYDHSLHRLVAIKEYLPGSLAHRDGTRNIVPHSDQQRETFEAGLKSFIQEARLLAQFDHPALVKVYRFWEANGTAYMATAYYEGATLKRAYSDTRPERDEVVHIIAPLLDAVEVMHRAKCYHRDIAPDNVILQPSGQAVLLDFPARHAGSSAR
jgi:serine/threonine protein kinase